jgi:hypothetical protein
MCSDAYPVIGRRDDDEVIVGPAVRGPAHRTARARAGLGTPFGHILLTSWGTLIVWLIA